MLNYIKKHYSLSLEARVWRLVFLRRFLFYVFIWLLLPFWLYLSAVLGGGSDDLFWIVFFISTFFVLFWFPILVIKRCHDFNHNGIILAILIFRFLAIAYLITYNNLYGAHEIFAILGFFTFQFLDISIEITILIGVTLLYLCLFLIPGTRGKNRYWEG